ncbi:MAG: SDR family oxidoreductase [Clostridiales bacterium]|nr:SDR family oxidoreductase [Clostridiales bacterium]
MSERRVILITGTRKGIGRYLAEYYAGQGFMVEGCSRNPSDQQSQNYSHHLADVTDEAQVIEMFSEIQKKHGRLDIAINNAGLASLNHFLLTPVSTVDAIFSVNFRATFLVCRESAKLMKKHNFGRIINITTVAVPMLLAGEAIYASSKSAVETLTKIIARELIQFGITCNAVGPAPVDTDLIKGVPKEKIDQLLKGLPVQKMANFQDITNVIDFFIKPESQNITAQVIYLGGVS